MSSEMITFDLMNTFTWLSQSLKINMCSDYKNRRKIVPKQDLKQCEWSDVKGKRYEVGNEIRHNLKFFKVWGCWYDNDSKIWKESKIQKEVLHLDQMPMRKCLSTSGQEAKFYNSIKVVSVQLIIGHYLSSLFHWKYFL